VRSRQIIPAGSELWSQVAVKRFIQFLAVAAVVAASLYATRCARHQRARSMALPVVAELGGKVGSITAPFGGTEYYISFAGRTLTRKDIDRLVVLNGLARNWNYVSVSLNDANISSMDREYMLQRLPEVHIIPIESNTIVKPDA
jgi:hypothetical protein